MHKIGVGEAKNCIFMHFFAYLYKVVHLDTDLKNDRQYYFYATLYNDLPCSNICSKSIEPRSFNLKTLHSAFTYQILPIIKLPTLSY